MVGGGSNRLLRSLGDLLDQLFPPLCPVCLSAPPAGTNPFCVDCEVGISPLPPGRCSRCALPFSAPAGSCHLCADCSRQAPPFAEVHAAGLYAGALRQALQRFKYAGAVDLDRPLANLLRRQFPVLRGDEILIPVPLHPHRLRERGYNQSLLLARALAYNLQISIDCSILQRRIDSQSQQGLGARQRALNLRGAFSCRRELAGERLLLVDDVMTTGATLASCSQVLLDAGATRVSAAVIARAPRQ